MYGLERDTKAQMHSTQFNRTAETLQIQPLSPVDRHKWQVLATKSRLRLGLDLSPREYDFAWQRLQAKTHIFGLGAHVSGELIGFAHCVIHVNVWNDTSYYLENLFVHESWRRQGVAQALIGAIAKRASRSGVGRFYWLTGEDNIAARTLYDKIAVNRGLIRYDFELKQADTQKPGAST